MTKWLDKYLVLNKTDCLGLERDCLIYNLNQRYPLDLSAQLAYDNYIKKKHEQAAGYHYAGMTYAHAKADHDSETKHSVMYSMHCKALCIDSLKTPTQNILSNVVVLKENHHFKAHPADFFCLK